VSGPKHGIGDLAGSTVWAVVVLVLGFLVFLAFLIDAGRSAELRGMLILVGQGFLGLVNIWLIYRSSLSTNRKVDSVQENVREVAHTADDIKETVNGTTPPPGSLPKAGP
jgi:hypothetical protein